MQVSHAKFGTGTVVSQDENNITVDFNGVIKTLLIKYAKLTNEDGTPFYTEPAKKVNPCKKTKTQYTPKPMTAEEKQASDIQTAKGFFLSVNDRWNSNTKYKVACQMLDKVQAKGNKFIESLIGSFYDKNFLSEKQAYALAKFAVETNQF